MLLLLLLILVLLLLVVVLLQDCGGLPGDGRRRGPHALPLQLVRQTATQGRAPNARRVMGCHTSRDEGLQRRENDS